MAAASKAVETDFQRIAFELALECKRMRDELAAERQKPWYRRILPPKPPPPDYGERLLEELRLRMKATRLLQAPPPARKP